MKQALFTRTIERVVAPDDEYGQLIKKTSQLLKRPYMQVFKMVEQWPPGMVAWMYEECTRRWQEKRYKSASHMWWTERRKKVLN